MLLKVHLPHQPRLLASKSHDIDDDDGDWSDDATPIIHRGYSRPKIVSIDIDDNEDDLDDYIKLRLFLAREIALRHMKRG